MSLKMERIFWIQGSRVEASRVQASRIEASSRPGFKSPNSKRPDSKHPGLQSPSVHIMHPESSFSGMSFVTNTVFFYYIDFVCFIS